MPSYRDKDIGLYNKDINVKIHTPNTDNLALALSRLSKKINKETDEMLKNHADKIIEEAKHLAPRHVPLGVSLRDGKPLAYVNKETATTKIGDDIITVNPFADVTNDFKLLDDIIFNGSLRNKGVKMGVPQDLKLDASLPEFNFPDYDKMNDALFKNNNNDNNKPSINDDGISSMWWRVKLPYSVFCDDDKNIGAVIPLDTSRKDPRPKFLNLPSMKNTKWVIDDLIPEDQILVFPKDAVQFIKDVDTGKEYIKIKKYKGKKISTKKKDNKKNE